MKTKNTEPMKSQPLGTKREKGLGPGSAGQSGDTQGLSDVAEASSESVVELVQEGQYFEADLVMGVEEAPDADVAEVHTQEDLENRTPSVPALDEVELKKKGKS